MTAAPDYAGFIARLKGYERVEPFPSNRRPDKLAGIRALLEQLGHPDQGPRIVHVAGTNGKGMTSTMIGRLIGRHGQTWGLYTSPHVMDIRERIVINGRWISEVEFAGAGNAVLDLADALKATVPLSYFDLLTAIGLVAFRNAGVMWVVLETGLGGTADATNVTPKVLAVITRIGLDHMYVLGNTLREIAGEKLGIVRSGVPVVIAEQDTELSQWLPKQAESRGALLVQSSRIRLVEEPAANQVAVTWSDGARFTVDYPQADFTDVRRQCAVTALAAADTLFGGIPPKERPALVSHALATRLPGRLEQRWRQRVGQSGTTLAHVVLDGGHNAPALAVLNAQLARWGVRDYTLILGMQADKLVEAVRPPLRELLAHAARLITLAPQTARAPTSEALDAFIAAELGERALPRITAPDAASALRTAAEDPTRPLVVTGSFWMLGDVMRLLEDAPPAR